MTEDERARRVMAVVHSLERALVGNNEWLTRDIGLSAVVYFAAAVATAHGADLDQFVERLRNCHAMLERTLGDALS